MHFVISISWETVLTTVSITQSFQSFRMTSEPNSDCSCSEANPESTSCVQCTWSPISNIYNLTTNEIQSYYCSSASSLPCYMSTLGQSCSERRGVMVTEGTLSLCLINVVGPEWGSILTTQEEIKRWWHFWGGICNFHKYEGVFKPSMTAHKINTNNLNP